MALTPTVPRAADANRITSAWGNEIRDRTFQVFSSAAERDAQWTAPPNGAHCVTLDNYAQYVRRGGTWQLFGAHDYTPPALGGDTTCPLSTNTNLFTWTVPGLATSEVCTVMFSIAVTQAALGAFDLTFSAATQSMTHQYPAGIAFGVVNCALVVRTGTTPFGTNLQVSTWGAKAVVVKAASNVNCHYVPSF